MKKVIFWDFDGTLSYPNKSFLTALAEALNECGYNIDGKKTEEFSKNAYSWHTPEIDYTDRIREKWWEDMSAKIDAFCKENGITEADFPKINRRFKEILTDVKNYTLYDDTISVLKKCTEIGYDNYILTNNYPEIRKNTEKLGIAPFFRGYIISSLVGYEKPRKELYDYAINLAGNPDICYMIGDNPIADIGGAKNAGITAVAVHECRESEADYYFETLSEIFEILK